MTTYKDIHGTQVEVRSDDPSNPVNGQVWYNTTDLKLRGGKFAAAAWASGGNLNTARASMSTAGTQTSAIGAGGYNPGGRSAASESYNGSAWTETNDLNAARQLSPTCTMISKS